MANAVTTGPAAETARRSSRSARRALAVAAVVLAIWSSWSGVTAQQPCAACGDQGVVACGSCALDVERQVQFCSEAAKCRACGGALVVRCPQCKSDAGKAELERRRALVQAWLDARAQGLAAAGVSHPLLQCRTAHFELAFAPGAIKDCPVRDRHQQMHLYAGLLESTWQRFVQVLALDAGKLPVEPRLQVAILRDDGDVRLLAAAWCGLEVQGLGASNEKRAAAVVEQDPQALRDDAALHRLVVHDVVHLLLGRLLGDALDEHGHGWLEAGLAHWFEADASDGLCDAACWLDHPQSTERFWSRQWRTAVRELLEADTLPPLSDVIGRDVADLDLAQHAVAFALVDWLTGHAGAPVTPAAGEPASAPAARHPLHELLDAAKKSVEPVLALREVTGMDLKTLDKALRDFVRESYPRR